MALREQLLNVDELDIDKLDFSQFIDDTTISDGGELSSVMAASCTTCECSCSVSSIPLAF